MPRTHATFLLPVLLVAAMLFAPLSATALAQGSSEDAAAMPTDDVADPSASPAQTFAAPLQPTSAPSIPPRQTPPRTGPKEILVSGARVAEYGLYAAQVFRGQPSGALVNGIRDDARDYRLAARTARVVVRRGTAIGLGYVITAPSARCTTRCGPSRPGWFRGCMPSRCAAKARSWPGAPSACGWASKRIGQ